MRRSFCIAPSNASWRGNAETSARPRCVWRDDSLSCIRGIALKTRPAPPTLGGMAAIKKSAAVVTVLLHAACAFSRQPASGPGDLDSAQVKQAISILRENSLSGTGIDDTTVERATLAGLLELLEPGAEVKQQGKAETKPSPFRSELLEGNTGYIRLGALGSENIAQLDAALQDFASKKVDGIVLDLRATPENQDYDLAAQAASRFVPPGTKLFSLVKAGGTEARAFNSSSAPLFSGILILVADGETAGAAEALAAALRGKADAMLVGAPTSGRAVEFTEVPLGGGKVLRYAASEVRVEKEPALYPDGLVPDLEVEQDEETRQAVLDGSLDKGVAGFVFETERPHMNEAALVAGTNPEIEEDTEEAPAPATIDRPLQRAVDLVTAMRIFRKRG
ncbi:MAG: hypothetical protein FGM15_05800 [Chthoniobacterales bacterium]|nr:hypothetical protein [Chthoniobacterales bacterium]